MKDTSNANCRELLEVMIAHGVRHLVASPGSRNAPLLIGASVRDKLKTTVVNDERTAGFIALGMAMASKRPVALACTSGTALYNYAPAIAEAYYQKIPLIVISADRPTQWIDQDDSQTLHQFEALGKIVKRSFDIPPETGMSTRCRNSEYESERDWFVNRVANEAVLTSIGKQPGPVHVNIQFAEPLNQLTEHKEKSIRIVNVIENDNGLPPHKLKELSEYLLSKRVMVVAGFMLPDDNLNRAIVEFSHLPNVTLMCETLSNLHLEGNPYMIDSLLVSLTEEEKKRMAPEIVISIGGALISRMLKDYLRGASRTEHWTLNDTPLSADSFQRLTTHIDVSPARFFKGIAGMSRHLIRKGHEPVVNNYAAEWQKLRIGIKERNDTSFEQYGWSEYYALGVLFKHLPTSFNVFLSNGTCVRYAQLLMDKLPHACYGNRGVSGIDGTNATATGISMIFKGTTLLITGDMSFSYCPEIMNRKISDSDLRIVVINNSGGGIFRFIKTTRDLKQREDYFCNSPELPLEKLAAAYNRPYKKVTSCSELRDSVDYLYSTPRAVLEIEVDAQKSADTLIQILNQKK